MKTVIVSFLFVALCYGAGISEKFKAISDELDSPPATSYMASVNSLKVHASLASMKCAGDEMEVFLCVISMLRGAEELAEAADRVSAFLDGKSSLMSLQDAKAFCRITAQSVKLGKAQFSKKFGPLVYKCRPELRDIYNGLMSIDTEERMLAFYETYLKDLK